MYLVNSQLSEISDNGPGIPLEIREKFLLPSLQQKRKSAEPA